MGQSAPLAMPRPFAPRARALPAPGPVGDGLREFWSALSASSAHAVASDEEAGHEFRGDQFTGGIGGGGGKPKMTIGQFAKEKLKEGHSPAKVAEMAQKEFGSKTTAASVSWYKSQMNKEAKGGENKYSNPTPKAPAAPQFKEPAKPAAPAHVGPPAEKDYIGGKSYYKMNASQKASAESEAKSISKNPDLHPPVKVAAAKAFLEHHEKQVAAAQAQAAKQEASEKASSKAGSLTPSELSHGEHAAAVSYTGAGYTHMNSDARAGKADAPSIKALDAAIAKSTLKEDVVLYHGIPADAAKTMFPGGVVKTGQVISDKGFASTSLEKNVAHSFAKGVVLHINAVKGAPALDVRHLSQHKGEAEVVLPRDAKLKVVGVLVPNSTPDYLHVSVEYGT